jgi:hypothetical protein
MSHSLTSAFGGVLGLAAVALAANAAPAVQIPSAAAISAEIDAKGAKEVVQRLWDANEGENRGRSDWDRVADQISLGRVAYIKLVPRLAPGTDGAAAEDIGISLAYALPIAPSAVLRVIELNDNNVVRGSRICGVPFLEGSMDDEPSYIRKASLAVSNVTASDLQKVKAACLETLRSVSKSYPAQ